MSLEECQTEGPIARCLEPFSGRRNRCLYAAVAQFIVTREQRQPKASDRGRHTRSHDHGWAGPKLVCIDVQPYTTTQGPDRSALLNVGGFSDAVFIVVASFLARDAGRFVTDRSDQLADEAHPWSQSRPRGGHFLLSMFETSRGSSRGKLPTLLLAVSFLCSRLWPHPVPGTGGACLDR